MSVCERLREVREALGKTQKEMSTLTGISYRTWQNYEDGVNNPGWDACEALTRLNVDANWLFTGEGSMWRVFGEPGMGKSALMMEKTKSLLDEGYVKVPRYDIAASAGGGAVVHSEQVVDYLAFRPEWIQEVLKVPPHALALISVVGDSMEPTLWSDDLILIDLRAYEIDIDAIYVLCVDGMLLVKRVQRNWSDGSIVVSSDNPRYKDQTFSGSDLERIKVVGRLIRRLVR